MFREPFDYHTMETPPQHEPGVLNIHRVLNLLAFSEGQPPEGISPARWAAIKNHALAHNTERQARRDEEEAERASSVAAKAHGSGISITLQPEGRRHWWRAKNHKKTHGDA